MPRVSIGHWTEVLIEDPNKLSNKFTGVVNYMFNVGLSLYEEIHKVGYSIKDLKTLITRVYDVEDFYGDFISKDDSELRMASRIFEHLKNSHKHKKLNPGHYDKGFKLDYGDSPDEAAEFKEVLGAPLSEVPLFINGTEVQKAIAKWRLDINK